jgi:hypothetical protein
LIKSSGLGVRKLIQFNRSLLGKSLGQYAMDREASWRLVIMTKYDIISKDWYSKEVTCDVPHCLEMKMCLYVYSHPS